MKDGEGKEEVSACFAARTVGREECGGERQIVLQAVHKYVEGRGCCEGCGGETTEMVRAIST
jgi:hypothetical protein